MVLITKQIFDQALTEKIIKRPLLLAGLATFILSGTLAYMFASGVLHVY